MTGKAVHFYCTDYAKDGKLYAGPELAAADWDEAEVQAKEQGLRVVGQLV